MSTGAIWVDDVDLTGLNTFRVAARAKRFARCSDIDSLRAALLDCRSQSVKPLILGGGSNLLLVKDPSAVIHPQLFGLAFIETADGAVEVIAGASENWDALVRACCDRGLWGIENLALIPGTVGAAPVQNIGAYGVELSDSLVWVRALDRDSDELCQLTADEMALSYRDSVFKREPDRWLILQVCLRLHRDAQPRLGYAGLEEALRGIESGSSPEPLKVANAVTVLRRTKLPDPAQVGNAGSFFKNPELPAEIAARIASRHPQLARFPAARADQVKLSAAWLIDQQGWKGFREGDAGISAQHALVLVNHGSASGAELLALARRVADTVESQFGVVLQPEPLIVGARFRPDE
jgi:UDP-N-acetylmuramate dehydrogenase